MNIRDKLAQHPLHVKKDNFDRALFRAGAIIIAGYLIGTLVAWLIAR